MSLLELIGGAIIGGLLTEVSNRRSERRRDDNARRIALGPGTVYSWEQLSEGANLVVERIMKPLKPDIVITYEGPSAIFANLVLLRYLTDGDLLRIPVLTGRFVRKGNTLDKVNQWSYEHFESRRFHVLMPSCICLGDRDWKIVIIDDTVTTGSSMQGLKNFLIDKNYREENIKTACFVCSESEDAMSSVDVACHFNRGTYKLPWDLGPL